LSAWFELQNNTIKLPRRQVDSPMYSPSGPGGGKKRYAPIVFVLATWFFDSQVLVRAGFVSSCHYWVQRRARFSNLKGGKKKKALMTQDVLVSIALVNYRRVRQARGGRVGFSIFLFIKTRASLTGVRLRRGGKRAT